MLTKISQISGAPERSASLISFFSCWNKENRVLILPGLVLASSNGISTKVSREDWACDLQTLHADDDLLSLQDALWESDVWDDFQKPHFQSFDEGFGFTDLETGVLTMSRVTPLVECNLVAFEPWFGTRKTSAEAFIERLASKSSMARKLYMRECPGEVAKPSGECLIQRLEEFGRE